MTKRILAALLILALPSAGMAFSVGTETIEDYGVDASGFNYVSTVEFDDGFVGWMNIATWGHTLNPSYMSVPDNFTVAQASLQIQGWRYSGFGGEIIACGGTLQWSGLQGWQMISYADNTFDITNIDHSFWNSSPLYVSLLPVFEAGINLTSSTLSVDYDQSTFSGGDPSGVASVPEPAALILMGLGLAAVGSWRRLRK